eukprot:830886_1
MDQSMTVFDMYAEDEAYDFKPTTPAPIKHVNVIGKEALNSVQFQIKQPKRRKKQWWRLCRCSLLPKDEENFDFYPASFFYYLIFEILLCLLMMTCDALIQQHILQPPSIQTHVIDYVLRYSVMLLLIWTSLFSFWKYYTTMAVVQSYEIVPTQDIMLRFVIYFIAFALLFVLQIHVFYWLWPVLLVTHSGFNLVCTMKFSSVLIEKYRLFMEIDDRMEKSDNESILRSVYSMRSLSATCNLLQTSYLALFCILYPMDIIYYLPILWCLSSAIASMTFVRNRKFIHFKLFELKQRIASHTVSATRNTPHEHTATSERQPPEPLNKSLKFSSVDTDSTFPTEFTGKSTQITRIMPPKQRNKALQLLGINRLKPVSLVYSQSDIISNRSGTISEAYRVSKIIPKKSHSDMTDINHTKTEAKEVNQTLESIVDVDESEYVPRTPLRRFSSGMYPDPVVMAHTVNVQDIDYIDDDEDDSCVYVGYHTHNAVDELVIDVFDEDDAKDIEMETKDVPLELKHQKSNSEPIDIQDLSNQIIQMDLKQVMDSLDLFAKYGFCSRSSINSLYQLTKYTNKINK